MAIEAGQQLLHYRLIEKIGEGGMGLVWKGVDTTLDRQVAIKILPDVFADQPERLARFEREARLLAALNHPNIAVVHGLHESDGVRFLAMELIEGEDLSQRLERGPLSIEETLAVGLQVAAALEAAHESGVIHRDLKPGNIQLMPDGTAKVLDFGLAKAFEPDPASGDASASPTVTSAGTVAGVLLGTAAYMSPQQARGHNVDKRADIWAFGCVMFEALCARKAFPGSTVSDTIAGILRGEPDWAALPAATPRPLLDLLARCLEKEARDRLRDIGDARIELTRATRRETSGSAVARAAGRPGIRRLATPRALGTLAVGVLAGAALWQVLRPVEPVSAASSREVSRFVVTIPEDQELTDVQISPDGRALVYIASVRTAGGRAERLYLRRFDTFDAEQIAEAKNIAWTTFSPDGRWLVYLVEEGRGSGTIFKAAADGSPPVVLIENVRPGGWSEIDWGPDDTLLFVDGGNLVRVPSAGGVPEILLDVDAEGETSVVLSTNSLPGSDLILLGVGYVDRGKLNRRTELFDPETGERRLLIPDGASATYTSTGHLIFEKDNALVAVPFDLRSLEITGPEKPLRTLPGPMDVSDNGTLVFQANAPLELQLVMVDRSGRIEKLEGFDSALPPGSRPMELRWSRDGSRIAVSVLDWSAGGRGELWIHDLERGVPMPLTFSGNFSTHPVWAPDGSELAFMAGSEDVAWRIYRRQVDGSGSPAFFGDGGSDGDFPLDWDPEGGFLLFFRSSEGPDGSGDLWIQPSDASAPPRPLFATPANELRSRLSPNGRWIAYSSDESGREEIWVSPYSTTGNDGPVRKTRVSIDGGERPVWSADGTVLFFADGTGRILGAPLRGVAALDLPAFDVPAVVLDRPALGLTGPFDVSPLDGRFLTALDVGEGRGSDQIFVVLNWYAELVERTR